MKASTLPRASYSWTMPNSPTPSACCDVSVRFAHCRTRRNVWMPASAPKSWPPQQPASACAGTSAGGVEALSRILGRAMRRPGGVAALLDQFAKPGILPPDSKRLHASKRARQSRAALVATSTCALVTATHPCAGAVLHTARMPMIVHCRDAAQSQVSVWPATAVAARACRRAPNTPVDSRCRATGVRPAGCAGRCCTPAAECRAAAARARAWPARN